MMWLPVAEQMLLEAVAKQNLRAECLLHLNNKEYAMVRTDVFLNFVKAHHEAHASVADNYMVQILHP